MPYRRIINTLKEADANELQSFCKKRIIEENLNLQAYAAIGNEMECLRAKHRIADAKIISLIATGDLTL